MVTLAPSEEERDALSLDVIPRAITTFTRRAILNRGWSPTKGAGLRTWFIGTCALNFPRAYQRWSRERADRLTRTTARHDIDMDAVGGRIAAGLPDPATTAIDRHALRHLLDAVQPTTKFILGRLMQGSTQQEIADELGWTVKAVSLRLYRLRKRIRDDQARRRRADMSEEAA